MSSNNRFYHPSEHSGVCVVRRKDESVEDLIKRFRKKFSKSGIIKEVKDKLYYQKPSEKKRKKSAQARRLKMVEEQKQQKIYDKMNKNKKGYDDDKSGRR